MNKNLTLRVGHYRLIYGTGRPRTAQVSIQAASQKAAQDPDVHVGTDGSVSIDAPGKNPELEKAVALLKASGRYIVESIENEKLGDAVRKVVAGHQSDNDALMIEGFAETIDIVVNKAGATSPDTGASATAQYEGLPEAAESASVTATKYEVETHNAHADPVFLHQGGKVLKNLLTLDGVITKASAQIGYTTVPLAGELAGDVGAVVRSVEEELPRNSAMERSLQAAITYNGKRAAKGKKTKAAIKAVKKKLGHDTSKKPTGPGGLPAGATGSPGGTGASGGGKVGIE